MDTELVFPSIHFMPDLFQLLQRRGRFLVVILIGSWLVTASVLWLMPPLYKSDQGELKVRIWDQNPVLAAALANALTAQLDSLHRDLLNRQNQETWSALQRASLRLETLRDSIPGAYAHQQEIYRQLIDQYALLLEQQPPAIHILDPATVSISPDKPEWLLILVAVTAVALLVGLLIALWMERRTDYAVDP